jgi:glycosyltransferase involved in cell wall biosynthesis
MLCLLLDDEDLRRETGRIAQQRIRRNYLWDDVSKQIEAVYLELMESSATEIIPARQAGESNAKIA